MQILFTPVGALVYLSLALIAAAAGRNRRMGFWGFFWASILLTQLLTGFFLLMAQQITQQPRQKPTQQSPVKPKRR